MKAVKNNTLLTSCVGKKKQNTSFNDTLANSGAFMTLSQSLVNHWMEMQGQAVPI